MNDPLPALHEAVLDASTFDALVADLQAHAQILELLVRDAGTTHAVTDLATAASALRAGTIRALQVRYRHADVEWRDTLALGPEGVRVVRLQTPSLGGSK